MCSTHRLTLFYRYNNILQTREARYGCERESGDITVRPEYLHTVLRESFLSASLLESASRISCRGDHPLRPPALPLREPVFARAPLPRRYRIVLFPARLRLRRANLGLGVRGR